MHKSCTRAGAHYSRMDFLSRRDSSHILFVYYQTKSDFITIIDSTSSELLSEVIKARQQVRKILSFGAAFVILSCDANKKIKE